jgi:hypothetical protein
MKARAKRVLISFSVVLVGYATWVAWPHFAPVEVTDHAGIPASEVAQIVNKLEDDGMFSGRGEFATVASSFVDPRSRPKYFAEIKGTSEQIVVTAGYCRGPLWGGGPIVDAKKVNDTWVFDPYGALWKN